MLDSDLLAHKLSSSIVFERPLLPVSAWETASILAQLALSVDTGTVLQAWLATLSVLPTLKHDTCATSATGLNRDQQSAARARAARAHIAEQVAVLKAAAGSDDWTWREKTAHLVSIGLIPASTSADGLRSRVMRYEEKSASKPGERKGKKEKEQKA